MFEIDPFLFSRPTQHKEGENRQHHPDPLIEIQTFSEYQHCTYQHHYRTGSIDGSHDGKRQMLHSEISEYPGREHDKRFYYNEFVFFPTGNRNFKHRPSQQIRSIYRQENERQKNQTGKDRVQKQNRKHGIVSQRLLLEHIIKTQQSC